MTSITAILSRLGQLEWYSVRPANLFADGCTLEAVPTVTFRFVDGNDLYFDTLREYLLMVDKKGDWRLIGRGEKNATIAPVAVCIEDNVASFELIEKINQDSPAKARHLATEFLRLTQELDKVINSSLYDKRS